MGSFIQWQTKARYNVFYINLLAEAGEGSPPAEGVLPHAFGSKLYPGY